MDCDTSARFYAVFLLNVTRIHALTEVESDKVEVCRIRASISLS